jgi:hypothetical protein
LKGGCAAGGNREGEASFGVVQCLGGLVELGMACRSVRVEDVVERVLVSSEKKPNSQYAHIECVCACACSMRVHVHADMHMAERGRGRGGKGVVFNVSVWRCAVWCACVCLHAHVCVRACVCMRASQVCVRALIGSIGTLGTAWRAFASASVYFSAASPNFFATNNAFPSAFSGAVPSTS